MKRQISMMKLLLAFASASLLLFFLLLCAAYSTLAYYRLLWIAKGIGPIGVDSFAETSFQPKAECSISKPSITLPLGGRLRN